MGGQTRKWTDKEVDRQGSGQTRKWTIKVFPIEALENVAPSVIPGYSPNDNAAIHL